MSIEKMSNNKPSSLDFYRKNLHSMVSGGSTEFKTEVEIFEKAKAMHKQENLQTWLHCLTENDPITFEDYYNSTFVGEDEQQ